MGTSILINKTTGWYINSVLLWRCVFRSCPVCLSTPTVPDLCCFARMPWHLPETIAPSCLKRWQQCGMIYKECWGWSCSGGGNWGFQQLDSTPLDHINSYVYQENKHATIIFAQPVPVLLWSTAFLRRCFVFSPLASNLSNRACAFSSHILFCSDSQFLSSQIIMFS